VLQAAILGFVEIPQRYQSVTDRRLRVGHLKRGTAPELTVESGGQCWPSTVMVGLQISNVFAESRKRRDRFLWPVCVVVTPDLNLEMLFGFDVAVTLATCCRASGSIRRCP
jgi:hypothetical protein